MQIIVPAAVVTAHPTVVLSTELPPTCAPGSSLQLGLLLQSSRMTCARCPTGLADTDGRPETLCTECPPGRYAPAGASACSPCDVGTRDVDADPATPCAAPVLVSGSVTLIGLANKPAADAGIAVAAGVAELNVELIQWCVRRPASTGLDSLHHHAAIDIAMQCSACPCQSHLSRLGS